MLTDNGYNNMVMPVSPMYGNSGGFGGWGDDGWLILILLFAMGGWGGFGMGGFGGGFGGMYEFPWLLNGQNGINANTNAGFNQAATASAISGLQNSVTSGFGDVQLGIAGVNQNVCQTGNSIVSAITNGNNALAQQMYTNQIADLERSFAAQTASSQGMNALQSQLAQCCCDNRLATCQTQNIVQNEGNATRFADANNTRDIIDSQNKGTQAILDKLCSLELEQKNDTIAQLRSELMYARGQASQDVQTAAIQAGQRTLANEIEQYVAPRAVPSYAVQNPNCCSPVYGCGM